MAKSLDDKLVGYLAKATGIGLALGAGPAGWIGLGTIATGIAGKKGVGLYLKRRERRRKERAVAADLAHQQRMDQLKLERSYRPPPSPTREQLFQQIKQVRETNRQMILGSGMSPDAITAALDEEERVYEHRLKQLLQ